MNNQVKEVRKAADGKSHMISPEDHLKKKIECPPGQGTKLDQSLIDQADRVVATKAPQFAFMLEEDIKKVIQTFENRESNPDWAKDIFEVAHEMRGTAGTFGFHMSSAVADNLCKYFDRVPEGAQPDDQITQLHMDALIKSGAIKGSMDETSANVVSGLRRILAAIAEL
jgi:chemotaxis protein histidine kinase CheA